MTRWYKISFIIIILLLLLPLASAYTTTSSSTLRYSNDGITGNFGTSYNMLKSITITAKMTGQINVTWDQTPGFGSPVYTKIYKNGSAVGVEKTRTTSASWFSEQDTITQSWNVGDTIELWGYDNTGVNLVVRNFRVQYDITPNPPSIPVSNSHLNYFNSSSTTVTWTTSTDSDGDPITYSIKVGTSSGATDILSYTGDTDTTSNSFVMTPQNSYYYSISACDQQNCSSYSTEKNFGFAITTLYTPTNGSTQTKSYPPLISDILFTWSEIGGGLNYNLKVAKDSNFNLIAVDITTANNYSTQALEAGNYWWKVQYYNSTSQTFYNWSTVFNFTLSNTQSSTGTAIQGTVYELVNGVTTPVSGATVFIQNSSSTWSNSMVTGSNGYYLFDGLSNTTTYYIYASKKDYQTSTAEYLTTGTGTWSTKNIQLKLTEPVFFEPDKQYVKFKVRWLYCIVSCDIPGTTITAYKSGEVTPSLTGITDSTGSISFLMYKTQLYRVTATNSTAGINQEMTIYPKDTDYIFMITNTDTGWTKYPIQEKDAINIAVSKNTINATHATITVNYTDSLSGTNPLTIYINQSNGTGIQTIITSWTNAGAGNHTFSISPYSGQQYLVHIVAIHSTYGTIDQTYSVFFEKSGVGISGIPDTLWLWFAVGFMFFTGAIFTASTAEKGFIIVCAEGWIFFMFGLFNSLNAAQFVISLTLASVIAIAAYIRQTQNREGYT